MLTVDANGRQEVDDPKRLAAQRVVHSEGLSGNLEVELESSTRQAEKRPARETRLALTLAADVKPSDGDPRRPSDDETRALWPRLRRSRVGGSEERHRQTQGQDDQQLPWGEGSVWHWGPPLLIEGSK